jgi:hypothetical protein
MGQQECDQSFVPSVEIALSMLKCWQESVKDPEEASLTKFRDLWCCGAPGIVSIAMGGSGQYQVIQEERNSSTIAEFQLIEKRDAYIRSTGVAVLLYFIADLMHLLASEVKRVDLHVANYHRWTDEELIRIRTVLRRLANVRLRQDEVRRLAARVGRELMLLPACVNNPEGDGPVERNHWLKFRNISHAEEATYATRNTISEWLGRRKGKEKQPDRAFQKDNDRAVYLNPTEVEHPQKALNYTPPTE